MAIQTWAIEEVRSGNISLWHGLLANIPTGYVLCDGTNGTPDLRDKFVKGAANGQNPGTTGGAATHTHAGHAAHVVTQANSHSVTGTRKGGTSGAATLTDSFTLTHSGMAVDAHSAHDSPNSEPPYYAIAYIMKL